LRLGFQRKAASQYVRESLLIPRKHNFSILRLLEKRDQKLQKTGQFLCAESPAKQDALQVHGIKRPEQFGEEFCEFKKRHVLHDHLVAEKEESKGGTL